MAYVTSRKAQGIWRLVLFLWKIVLMTGGDNVTLGIQKGTL